MNTTAREILEIIHKDPLPVAHTSSYWQAFGSQITVEVKGDQLVLQSAGCESLEKERFYNRCLHFLERAYCYPITSHLSAYPKIWETALSLCRDLSCTPNFYVFKSAVALSTLAQHWKKHTLNPQTFAVIGDEYGFLGALIRRYRPDSRLYSIDLPKMLAFQCRTHQLVDPDGKMMLLAEKKNVTSSSVFFIPRKGRRVLGMASPTLGLGRRGPHCSRSGWIARPILKGARMTRSGPNPWPRINSCTGVC